ncbi:hypothetical protein HDU79_002679 [Rhizoclosmatium sp. JEL0117]|nr:hypothetical protein HDU79_002679 [Rhizoclosmatium sp. JEL0117]
MAETTPLLSPASSSSSITNWDRNSGRYGSTLNFHPKPRGTSCHVQDAVVDDIHELYYLKLSGYKVNPVKLWIARAMYLCSLGGVYLFCRWFPEFGAKLHCDKCGIDEADLICVVNPWKEVSVVSVTKVPLPGGMLFDVFGTKTPAMPDRENIPMETISVFYYNSIKFILNPDTLRYETVLNWRDPWWGFSHDMTEGIGTMDEIRKRQTIFDENKVQIEGEHWVDLLLEEICKPMFLLQVLCMLEWYNDEYSSYGNFIVFVQVMSILNAFWEAAAKKNLVDGMCQQEGMTRVKRCGEWRFIQKADLVPGDVIEVGVDDQESLPCDAVLVSGSCIMMESMLTGESKPVSKSAILHDELAQLDFTIADPSNSRQMSRFFLFYGTKVVRSRGDEVTGSFHSSSNHSKALALVVRIGVNTTKGCLMRSIMHPKPHTASFVRDSFGYVVLLIAIFFVGGYITVYNFYMEGYPWRDIVLRTGDLYTIVVPVALPATIAVGVGFSINRLRRVGIYCLAAARVNVCGQIDVMCFDKTGTLTQEGLDLLGFRCVIPGSDPTKPRRFTHILSSVEDAFDLNVYENVSTDQLFVDSRSEFPKIVTAMASCHSIKILDGELVGDPVDLRMFELSGWEIEEGSSGNHENGFTSLIVRPPSSTDWKDSLRESVKAAITPLGSHAASFSTQPNLYTEIGVIRSFEFVNKLRRMSVITRKLNFNRQSIYAVPPSASLENLMKMKPKTAREFDVYCKGAPEVLLTLCNPQSIPPDYEQLLHRYAHHGYHVIAIATKVFSNISWLKLMRMRREEVECDLHFLGFLVFDNKLKPVTQSVVSTLNAAKIRQVMCTGDNILTAISVARDCGIMERDARVFAPRFENEKRGADAVVIWEDVDQDERTKSNISMQLELDPVTLKPVIAIKTTDIVDPEEEEEYQLGEHFVPERFVEVEIKEDYQLAVTGEVFSWMLKYSDKWTSFYRMLIKAQVFARMSPEQKKLLVANLQELGYCVGFCGDGANDWGALQAADVGVSLSEVEISVAAQFTSKVNSIACIVTLIREGRAALVTSFGSCKYMIVNQLIQTSSVMILTAIFSNLTEWQFPYVDFLITVPIAVFMTESGPHALLGPKRPTSSLSSKKVLISILGQTFIQALFQLLIFYDVQNKPYYVKPDLNIPDAQLKSYENHCVFLLSTYQYIFVAIIYCDGAPYRENFWRNTRFILTCIFLFGCSLYLTLVPTEGSLAFLELITVPMECRIYILCFAAVNLVVSSAAEIWVFPILAKLAGWAYIEYHSLYDDDDEPIDDYTPFESTRAMRRERALRRKWKRKGKLYKIVEQDLEY